MKYKWTVSFHSDNLFKAFINKKDTPWYSWNIAESGVKHDKSNQIYKVYIVNNNVISTQYSMRGTFMYIIPRNFCH